MKKITILVAILVSVLTVNAQYKVRVVSPNTRYNPYVSVGTSLSNGTASYGAEYGVYNNKHWFGVGVYTYSFEDKQVNYGQIKYYHKVYNSGIIDYFGYGTVNVKLDGSKSMIFEPGLVLVANVHRKFAPQLSITVPIEEGSQPLHQLPLSVGIGFNYWIK